MTYFQTNVFNDDDKVVDFDIVSSQTKKNNRKVVDIFHLIFRLMNFISSHGRSHFKEKKILIYFNFIIWDLYRQA